MHIMQPHPYGKGVSPMKDSLIISCKDRPLAQTIQLIREILQKLDVKLTESWFHNMGSFYSCRVCIEGTQICAYGKGTSRDQAMASALGEFMEELLNQMLIPYECLNQTVVSKHNFVLDPLEKTFAVSDAPPLPEDFRKYPSNIAGPNLYEVWEKIRLDVNSPSDKQIMVPYYNVNEDKLEYLPCRFLMDIYHSNGMCAGNTPLEAINHGICEIFERCAAVQIYYNRITPPTIPLSYIKEEAPVQYELIKVMEESGDFLVTVKDCSLGGVFPVVGVLIVSKKTQRYQFRLGADPNFRIALERCLTEYFQMNKDHSNLSVIDLQLKLSGRELYDDFELFLITGKGRFPASLFDDKSSYEFTAVSRKPFVNQKSRFAYLIELIQKLGSNIFIRDVSLLGFYAYQIIIPGLSEIAVDGENLGSRPDVFSSMKCLSSLESLENERLVELAAGIEYYKHHCKIEGFITVGDYARINGYSRTRLMSCPLDLLLTVVYCKTGQVQKAYQTMTEFIASLEKIRLVNNKTLPDLNFYYALKEFLGLFIRYPGNLGKIKRMLCHVFAADVVEKTAGFFNDIEMNFKSTAACIFGQERPCCYECHQCTMKTKCNYKKIENIYLKLKDYILKEPVEQLELRKLFIGNNFRNLTALPGISPGCEKTEPKTEAATGVRLCD